MSTSLSAKLDYRNTGRKTLGRRLMEMEQIHQRCLEELEHARQALQRRNKQYETLEALYRIVVKQLNAVPQTLRKVQP